MARARERARLGRDMCEPPQLCELQFWCFVPKLASCAMAFLDLLLLGVFIFYKLKCVV